MPFVLIFHRYEDGETEHLLQEELDAVLKDPEAVRIRLAEVLAAGTGGDDQHPTEPQSQQRRRQRDASEPGGNRENDENEAAMLAAAGAAGGAQHKRRRVLGDATERSRNFLGEERRSK